jgi:hypothetical protein
MGDEPLLHIRNGRAQRHQRTLGDGVTWCGKKLLGHPERDESDRQVFSSYGAEVHVTDNPGGGTCSRCRTAFDAAYAAAFPNGPQPIATFRLDSPEDMARAKAMFSPDALRSLVHDQ